MYELIVGIPPFNDQTVEQVFDNILAHRMEWPEIGDGEDQISENAYDLINKILEPDYQKRPTLDQIRNHAFFKSVDWGSIRQTEAPIIPIRDLEFVEHEEVDENKKNYEQAKMQKLLART